MKVLIVITALALNSLTALSTPPAGENPDLHEKAASEANQAAKQLRPLADGETKPSQGEPVVVLNQLFEKTECLEQAPPNGQLRGICYSRKNDKMTNNGQLIKDKKGAWEMIEVGNSELSEPTKIVGFTDGGDFKLEKGKQTLGMLLPGSGFHEEIEKQEAPRCWGFQKEKDLGTGASGASTQASSLKWDVDFRYGKSPEGKVYLVLKAKSNQILRRIDPSTSKVMMEVAAERESICLVHVIGADQ